MSSQTISFSDLTPDQIYQLTQVPQELGEPRVWQHAPITGHYATTLLSYGLAEKAQRVADVDHTWRCYRASEDNSDVWRQHPYTLMLRSDPHHALRLSKQLERKYSRLIDLSIHQKLTRIDLRFSFQSKEESDAIIRHCRKLLTTHLLRSIDTIGLCDDHLRRYQYSIKVLSPEHVTREQIIKLQSALPPGVSLRYYHFERSKFDDELRAWSRTGLEVQDATFEYILHGLYQSVPHGISKEDQQRFALTGKKKGNANLYDLDVPEELPPGVTEADYHPPAPKLPVRYVPRSPKTGQLARYETGILHGDIDWREIRPYEWLPIRT